MNLNVVNRLATFCIRFLDTKKPTKPIIETLPQKPPIPSVSRKESFLRTTPESCGVSSKLIYDYVQKIAADKTLNMHSIMILRDGKVMFECCFGGQDISTPKMTFSACKSITSIAIGMLIDDGILSLSESVSQIFEDRINLIDKIRLDAITVEDLLTMRSGIVFNEAEAFALSNWIKSFFSSATQGKPGESFEYNSLNTYILSAIVYKKTGTHLQAYLSERLFTPLGITDYAWEKCPMGIEKGGWGLYMRPEDMAKIGTLVMNGGTWENKRIISEEYLKSATSSHAVTPDRIGNFNYGYQIWVGKDTDTFLFNGMLGQNVLGFRKNGIIIVSNAGNGELFQQSSFYKLTLDTFDASFPKSAPENRKACKDLSAFAKTLVFGGKKIFSRNVNKSFAEFERFLLPSYETTDENARSFGLMPVILQATQSNYTSGTKSISFLYDKDAASLAVAFEEENETYTFRAGFTCGEKTEISFRGEKFIVCAFARFAYSEDDCPMLIVRIDFTETPCSRVLKFCFFEDSMVCKATEEPGADFVVSSAGEKLSRILEESLGAKIAEKIDTGYIEYKLEKIFSNKINFKPRIKRD